MRCFCLILILSLSACQETFTFEAPVASVSTATQSSTATATDPTISSLTIDPAKDQTLSLYHPQYLSVTVTLSNGKTYSGVTDELKTTYKDLGDSVVWYSNNDNVATVSRTGRVMSVAAGTTYIKATLGTKSASIKITVEDIEQIDETDATESNDPVDQTSAPDEIEEQIEADPTDPVDFSEEPTNPDDRFLNVNDTIDISELASDGGYGADDFPENLYGPPGDDLDVLSFGSGGSVTISLGGFVLVDGDGPDFTIFENPRTGWQECAEVSVSDDGENFYDFSCESYDPEAVFTGCAGVTNVNYGLADADYYNPEISGGDVFDLADLEIALTQVRFIKITDLGLCTTSEVMKVSLPNGFDLDAVALINGQNL